MTYPVIDARGRSCPEPVILSKKALEKSPEGICVLVDNTTARDNISRFAKGAGYLVESALDGFDYKITVSR